MRVWARSMLLLAVLLWLSGCASSRCDREVFGDRIEELNSRTGYRLHCARYDEDGYVVGLGLRELTLLSRDIELISRCRKLKLLALSETNVHEFDLSALGKLVALERLYLEDTGLTTDQVQFLRNIRTLRWLGVDHTNVDNGLLDLIGQNKGLRHLGISGTKVNAPLTRIVSLFPQLEKLVISKATYGEEEIQAARRLRPKLKIYAL